MARNINAINTTKYLGVNAPTPPNLVRFGRSPTSEDFQGMEIGTLWVDSSVNPSSSQDIYILMNVNQNVATWVPFAGTEGTIQTLTGNSGTPVSPDINNNINVVGSSILNTIGVANTLGIRFNQGNNGEVPIAATASPTSYETLTSSDSSIVITNGPNAIDLAAVKGTGTTNEITTDSGTAEPIDNTINMLGGEFINTSALGDTVTINLNRGEDGQIPIAATGAATQYANITSNDESLTITNTANGIDIINNGTGGSSITVTAFNSSGTFTKKADTKWIHVYGWSGGGGGGSGQKGNPAFGGGGGSGAIVFDLEMPSEQFGATETVTIGAGGIGASARTTTSNGNNGGNGGISSVGTIRPYPVSNGGVGGNPSIPTSPSLGYGEQPKIIRGWEFIYPSLPIETSFGGVGSMTNSIYLGGGGGGGTINGAGSATRGGYANSYGQNFIVDQVCSTSGGGGGGTQYSTDGSVSGGASGGAIASFNTVDYILVGGNGGIDTGDLDGKPGNSRDGVTGGTMIGSTGGGGGSGQKNSLTRGGDGGVGAVPGAGGGGGGGATTSGTRSGAGGNGGNGTVVIFEFA